MFEQPLHDRPRARTERLAIQRVDDELVVYDELTHTAHCLSADASAVWELCDGERSIEEIARELGRDPAQARRAVAELEEVSLLEHPSPAMGISRREAAKRFAKVGGAALAAQMVYSVAIPAAAAAASCHLSAGTSVTCGTASGQCNAAAGSNSGTVVGTSCKCYQAANNTGCWVSTNTCSVQGGACTHDSDCCDPVANNCNTGQSKCKQ